jgi:hypothetical protein
MVTKKLFALASVSAIAGLMTSVGMSAGCSTTTTESGSSSGSTTDSGGTKDSGGSKTDRAPVGDPEDDTTATDCPADVPLTEADLDKEVGWKPAKASPGVCSAADLTKLEANFKNTNIKTYFDLG